jgi:hypothetical protein
MEIPIKFQKERKTADSKAFNGGSMPNSRKR